MKRKLDMSGTWAVRRMGKIFRVCDGEGTEQANVEFRTQEEAQEFAQEANRMLWEGL